MDMGICLQMRQSPMLELRQSLECSLELTVKQKLQMAMVMYQKRENVCTRLYKGALKKGMVRQYKKHGMIFEFALVQKQDVPEWIWKDCGHAFSHCLMKGGWEYFLYGRRYAMAKGSWLLFAIYDFYGKDKMPEKAVEYAAVHERGEMITLGDHNLASRLEFAIATKEGKIKWYMDWIENTCPAKFADVFSYQTHLVLPDGEELRETLETFQSSEEASEAKRMMENFEWPFTILKRLKECDEANKKIIGIITRAFILAGDEAKKSYLPVAQVVAQTEAVIRNGLGEIVSCGLKKQISIVSIEGLWKDERAKLDQIFSKMLEQKQRMLGNKAFLDEIDVAGVSDSISNSGILSAEFGEIMKHF